MSYSYSFEESLKLAEAAFAHMARNRVAANPDNFEVWFTYAAGTNDELTASVDEALAKGDRVTSMDMQNFSDTLAEDDSYADAVNEMGQRMSATMKQMSKSLEDAGKNTTEYGETLSGVSDQLDKATDPAAMQAMIEELVTATQSMEERSRELESRLAESTDEVNSLRTNLKTIRTESLTDQLTGIANRRAFDENLLSSQGTSLTDGTPMSLLIGDIDKFKIFNDTFGHQTGDQVLKLVAHCLTQTVKGKDMAARYGGEEFAVILPNTELAKALVVGEQIRSLVESKKVVKRSTGESLGTITLSLGVAEFRPGETLPELVERADSCLYAAKNAGRNRVLGEVELAASSAA